jgi:energy-coupling factor transporter ATP-binding protein EcfA2
VILFDEPFTGLDEAAALSLSGILEELNTPERVLIVTLHDVSRALSGPQRLLVLSSGRIVLDTPTHLPGEDVAETYLGLLRSEAGR